MTTIASIDEWGDNPVRPPAGELPEPLLQRFLAQAARHGKEIERLKADVSEAYRKGEAAVSSLMAENDRLKAENERLHKAHDRLYDRLYGSNCDRRPCSCGMHRDRT